jgi:hypothetical protein
LLIASSKSVLAGPRLPPRRIDARVSSDKPEVSVLSVWQAKQLLRRIGRTVVS